MSTVLAAGTTSTMTFIVVIGLMGLAGILAGGAWQLREHRVMAVVLGLASLLALAGGILWQVT